MISRHCHVQRGTRVAQVLCGKHRALLADQKGSLDGMSVAASQRDGFTYAESVAAHVVGADGEVADLEALDPMDVQPLVHHASMLGDRASLSRCHAAGSERVPGGFDVALDCEVRNTQPMGRLRLTPFLNVLDILVAVL